MRERIRNSKLNEYEIQDKPQNFVDLSLFFEDRLKYEKETSNVKNTKPIMTIDNCIVNLQRMLIQKTCVYYIRKLCYNQHLERYIEIYDNWRWDEQ